MSQRTSKIRVKRGDCEIEVIGTFLKEAKQYFDLLAKKYFDEPAKETISIG